MIPNGEDEIYKDDIIILTAPGAENPIDIGLNEIKINKNHKWIKKEIKDINISPINTLIVMIKRNDDIIVPDGNTLIEENDIVVMTKVN